MEYNKNVLSIAFVFVFSAGLAIGYVIGSNALPVSNNAYVKNNDFASKKPVESAKRNIVQNDLSAKDALQLADQEALAWANDSYISEISLYSKNLSKEGKANGWQFVFYSKARNKLFEIIIKDGESRGGKEKETSSEPRTLKGELIDSTLLAKAFFDTYPADTEIISLKMYYEPDAKKFLWTIYFPQGNHTIDAEI